MVFSMCLPRYFLEEQTFCHNHSLSVALYMHFEHCWHLAESLKFESVCFTNVWPCHTKVYHLFYSAWGHNLQIKS